MEIDPKQLWDFIDTFGWPIVILVGLWRGIITWGKDTAYWKAKAEKAMDRNEVMADDFIQGVQRGYIKVDKEAG